MSRVITYPCCHHCGKGPHGRHVQPCDSLGCVGATEISPPKVDLTKVIATGQTGCPPMTVTVFTDGGDY